MSQRHLFLGKELLCLQFFVQRERVLLDGIAMDSEVSSIAGKAASAKELHRFGATEYPLHPETKISLVGMKCLIDQSKVVALCVILHDEERSKAKLVLHPLPARAAEREVSARRISHGDVHKVLWLAILLQSAFIEDCPICEFVPVEADVKEVRVIACADIRQWADEDGRVDEEESGGVESSFVVGVACDEGANGGRRELSVLGREKATYTDHQRRERGPALVVHANPVKVEDGVDNPIDVLLAAGDHELSREVAGKSLWKGRGRGSGEGGEEEEGVGEGAEKWNEAHGE